MLKTTIIAASLTFLGGGTAIAQTTTEESIPPVEEEITREVISVKVNHPQKRVERKRHFKPDSKPSPSKVKWIANYERKKWGGPSLIGRIWCESTGRWSAKNGRYRGLLQIGPWWNYAYPRTPKGVRVIKKKHQKKPIIKYTEYSDGTTTKEKVGKIKQKIVIIKKGKLPKGASPYHGWAAIRVGQRAVSGDGPSTAWEC